jgi:hypothetical protein
VAHGALAEVPSSFAMVVPSFAVEQPWVLVYSSQLALAIAFFGLVASIVEP